MPKVSTLDGSAEYTLRFFYEHFDLAHADAVFRFRKEVLVDLHGWQLNVEDGRERDEFDTPETIHAALMHRGFLVGSFRAIRADQPYLAATKFPALAIDRQYTRSPLSWEISRLVVAPGEKRFETSMMVYASMFRFLEIQGGNSIVGFCDIAHRRLLERVGIETRSYGPAMEIGRDAHNRPVVVVAGEMPLPTNPSLRFKKLMSFANQMEIKDGTTVFGYSSLSA